MPPKYQTLEDPDYLKKMKYTDTKEKLCRYQIQKLKLLVLTINIYCQVLIVLHEKHHTSVFN